MTPKIDPYATPRARTFDAFLCLLTIIVILIALATAPHARSNMNATTARHAPALATR
jgi:hypothetical protein